MVAKYSLFLVLPFKTYFAIYIEYRECLVQAFWFQVLSTTSLCEVHLQLYPQARLCLHFGKMDLRWRVLLSVISRGSRYYCICLYFALPHKFVLLDV